MSLFTLFGTCRITKIVLNYKCICLLKDILFRAAITCMGYMYKNLGRMMGRSYEETVYILIKCLKNAESQMRVEIIITLEKVGNKLIIFKYLIYIIFEKTVYVEQ